MINCNNNHCDILCDHVICATFFVPLARGHPEPLGSVSFSQSRLSLSLALTHLGFFSFLSILLSLTFALSLSSLSYHRLKKTEVTVENLRFYAYFCVVLLRPIKLMTQQQPSNFHLKFCSKSAFINRLVFGHERM